MRRTPFTRRLVAAGAAVTLVSLGVLAGCSGSSSDPDASASATPTASAAADTSAADQAALQSVVVAGDPGAEPTVTLPATPFSVGDQVAVLLTPGTGETLEEGSLLQIDSTWISGDDGSVLGSTYTEGAAAETLALSADTLPSSLVDVLVGATVGTRVLFAAPNSGTTQVAVVDVAGIVPSRAEGTAVTPPAGLPAVTLAEDGAPSIAPVAGDPPAELVVQPLIQGAGATVASGDTVTVQYTGWLWDGTEFDSSWTGAPFSFVVGAGNVIPGWDAGVVGQTVGSQLLLVIPPDQGYGDAGSGDTIPGGSTLVFVVDVLTTSSAG